MPASEIAIWSLVAANIINLIVTYFNSYVQEKGKNLATKEDIEKITTKIELVKSDIVILTHKKTSLSSEKEKSLFEFYGKYSSWMNYALHLSILPNNESPDLYRENSDNKLDSLYQDFLFSESKL
jgi:DNA replication protein DnaD